MRAIAALAVVAAAAIGVSAQPQDDQPYGTMLDRALSPSAAAAEWNRTLIHVLLVCPCCLRVCVLPLSAA